MNGINIKKEIKLLFVEKQLTKTNKFSKVTEYNFKMKRVYFYNSEVKNWSFYYLTLRLIITRNLD